MDNHLEKYLEQLNGFIYADELFTNEEWQAFQAIWQLFEVKRKTPITVPGEVEKYLYFVIDGSQRVYFNADSGKEATLVFTYPHSFGGVLDSFLQQKPADYVFESLSKSVFLRASHADLMKLMDQYPAIDQFIKQALYAVLSGLLERMKELQCYSSEEKFKALLKRSPHILQVVPHKYLANYLGIDPTNFSKLLNSVEV